MDSIISVTLTDAENLIGQKYFKFLHISALREELPRMKSDAFDIMNGKYEFQRK